MIYPCPLCYDINIYAGTRDYKYYKILSDTIQIVRYIFIVDVTFFFYLFVKLLRGIGIRKNLLIFNLQSVYYPKLQLNLLPYLAKKSSLSYEKCVKCFHKYLIDV
jgi:hypothetical protein